MYRDDSIIHIKAFPRNFTDHPRLRLHMNVIPGRQLRTPMGNRKQPAGILFIPEQQIVFFVKDHLEGDPFMFHDIDLALPDRVQEFGLHNEVDPRRQVLESFILR